MLSIYPGPNEIAPVNFFNKIACNVSTNYTYTYRNETGPKQHCSNTWQKKRRKCVAKAGMCLADTLQTHKRNIFSKYRNAQLLVHNYSSVLKTP